MSINFNDCSLKDRLLLQYAIESEKHEKKLTTRISRYFFPKEEHPPLTERESITVFINFYDHFRFVDIKEEMDKPKAQTVYTAIGKDEFESYKKIYKIYRRTNPFFESIDFYQMGIDKVNSLIASAGFNYEKYEEIKTFLKPYFLKYCTDQLKNIS